MYRNVSSVISSRLCGNFQFTGIFHLLYLRIYAVISLYRHFSSVFRGILLTSDITVWVIYFSQAFYICIILRVFASRYFYFFRSSNLSKTFYYRHLSSVLSFAFFRGIFIMFRNFLLNYAYNAFIIKHVFRYCTSELNLIRNFHLNSNWFLA